MKSFVTLISAVDSTTSSTAKRQAVERYLQEANESDKLWCVALLFGKRPKRPVKTALLRKWAAEQANIPLWLFEESYHVVGDLAETVALVLQAPERSNNATLTQRMLELQGLKGLEEQEVEVYIKTCWREMHTQERFVFNKLITGGFRIGVSEKVVVKALAKYLNTEENAIAHRIMGNWSPQSTTFHDLLVEPNPDDNISKPYPFCLAYPIEGEPSSLGSVDDWQFEFKWDGIRGQLIFRKGEAFLWSRGEELITDRFPEISAAAIELPHSAVIDGEIMAFKDGEPMSFSVLQTRIGRKTVSKKILTDAPVLMMAYDLLELNGQDLREMPLQERRSLLENLVKEAGSPALIISKALEVQSWKAAAELREGSRERSAEGLMLKRKAGHYGVGRKRGEWWKWKVDPLSIDAVLIYAMRGHGRRANLFSDYTFAVWDEGQLVPVAKAYSGLTDKEMQVVDQFVKRNTIERFGPVRSVTPQLVFEIGFEGIAHSPRHKSGVALRFPRMLRFRDDKKPADANSLDDLKALLA